MTIQEILKKLVKKRGLRRVARELNIDHGSLYRSLESDLRLSRVEAILNIFGCELGILKRKEVKPSKPSRSRRKSKRR